MSAPKTTTPLAEVIQGGHTPGRVIRRFKNRTFIVVCFAATLIGMVMLGVLLWSIWRDGGGRINWAFLNEFPSRIATRAGIKSALFGSIWIVVLTGLFTVPIGVGAAIYLEEFTQRKNRFTAFVQLNISNLAGVPSIVYGLLGLGVFVYTFGLGRSIIAGALTMTLLVLPMMITVAQEALRAVPKSYREGALALGATQWQTISSQVLPCASSGIFTGVILTLSRAIGETAPLIVIGAVSFIASTPKSIHDPFTVLPIQIFNWSSQPSKAFHEAAAAAIIVLVVVLLLLNSVAIILRARARARFKA